MSHRRSFISSVIAVALILSSAAWAAAQHMGHGAGAGTTSGSMHGSTNPMMAGDQMMRNVDSLLQNAESMIRNLTAMPAMGSQHTQMMAGMNGMLDQMRAVHGNLTSMMKDPALMHEQTAGKAFSQACRDLEKMASGFESMTRNLGQAMKSMNHGGK